MISQLYASRRCVHEHVCLIMFVTSTEITESINKLFNFNKLLYFLNLELTVKSLTHQVISKALLLLSLEDDHNYILTQLKKSVN